MSIDHTKSNFKFTKPYWKSLDESSPLIERSSSIMSHCLSKVHSFAEETGVLRNDVDIKHYPKITPFSMNASAFLAGKELQVDIGSLLLIDPTKLPLKFKVNDFNDGKLKNKEFIDDILTWINNEYFKIDEFNCDDLSEQDRDELKKFIVRAENPELFEKMVEFIFAHELSHHIYEHPNDCANARNKSAKDVDKMVILSSLGSAGLMGTLCAIISKGSKLKILFCVLGSLFGGALGAALSGYYILNRMKGYRKQEKEADLMAAKSLKDVSGAVYFFNSDIQYRNYHLNQKSESEKEGFIKNTRQSYCYSTHPTSEERIVYIEASDKDIPMNELGITPSVPFQWS